MNSYYFKPKNKVKFLFLVLLSSFIILSNITEPILAKEEGGTITEEQLGTIAQAFTDAEGAMDDKCYTYLVETIFKKGVPQNLYSFLKENYGEKYINKWGISTTTYFDLNNFKQNYSKFFGYLTSTRLSDSENLLLWNQPDIENCSCCTFLNDWSNAAGTVTKNLLELLKKYHDKPSEDTFNALINALNPKEISKALEKEQENIEQINFGASGGILIPSNQLVSEEDTTCLITHESPCALPATWNWLNPLDAVVGGLFYAIYLISRGILVFILKIFEWLLNPQNFGGYIKFLNTDTVTTLFDTFKNFANLGIVLAMIFTAIATIFRNEKYGWKKMLPKILIIALLVNFALILSDILVDLSNYLSMASIYAFSSNISLSNLLVNCSICPTVQSIYKLGGAWDLVKATGFGTVLTFLFAFQFFGLVMYVGSRIVTILICLITSPIAFLSFAIPEGEKLWDLWRQKFQQALVVLPVLCFTFYISLFFINTLASNITENIKSNSHGVFIETIAYMVFISIFAQLVRYVAKFLGVEQVEKGFQ